MRSASCAALLLAAAALAACESSTESAETAPATGEARESEEDDSDTAPFMIVVEHPDGRRCGGSLVSLRTALTSAWCAGGSGGAAPAELWALAPDAGAARRVSRVALAAGADLAVLELEAPFGGGARSRPILMATRAAECAPRASCHVVRALGGGRAPRRRIVDATLAAGETCAARAPAWPGLRDTALCLVGPTLCESDRGAGVVCEGKLCGVLSRSAPEGGAAEGGAHSCGDTHVAQSIPRWRRFLHCAHTLRACGRGGDCGKLCSERRLLGPDGDTPAPSSVEPGARSTTPEAAEAPEAPEAAEAPEPPEPTDGAESSADTEAPPEQPPALTTSLLTIHAQSMPRPLRLPSAAPPTRSAPPSAAPLTSPSSARTAFEFEPNRPDFKAGEYGDNAADYGDDDAPRHTGTKPAESSAPPTQSSAAPNATGAAPPYPPAPPPAPQPERRPGALAARVHPVSVKSRAAPPPVHAAYLLYVLVAITNLVN